MTLDEILAKKEELTEENKKNRVLIEEMQQKIHDNRMEMFKLTQEENKLLYKNHFDVGNHFIKIDIGWSHCNLFTIYRVTQSIANGTTVKFDKITYRYDDSEVRFIFENSGMEKVKTITNDGFMFVKQDIIDKLFKEAIQLKTKEVIDVLVEIKNTWGQE